jgi:hypothetical protein
MRHDNSEWKEGRLTLSEAALLRRLAAQLGVETVCETVIVLVRVTRGDFARTCNDRCRASTAAIAPQRSCWRMKTCACTRSTQRATRTRLAAPKLLRDCSRSASSSSSATQGLLLAAYAHSLAVVRVCGGNFGLTRSWNSTLGPIGWCGQGDSACVRGCQPRRPLRSYSRGRGPSIRRASAGPGPPAQHVQPARASGHGRRGCVAVAQFCAAARCSVCNVVVYVCWAGCDNWNCDVPTKTWRELVGTRVIEEIACHTQDRTHGYCYGVRVAVS